MVHIPEDHPRYQSLMTREKITEAVEDGICSPIGLIAHGRGEALDYMIGEETIGHAMLATRVSVAMLLLAKRPVLSINGNTAALVPGDIVRLCEVLNARLEVNLFYRTEERVRRIVERLKQSGAGEVLGENPDARIPGIEHARSKAYKEGIYSADVVLVPLEDGDRCSALVNMQKCVITIDLNPLSRTSQTATVTIVDNIIRVIPNMISLAPEMKDMKDEDLKEIVGGFDNKRNLKDTISYIGDRLGTLSK
ncbi:MAG: 4-phosphopantoate--beta-alanine ligase [Halobacteriota archaeon]|nr:4-phosphopantoate--beta-alanine ligase [Halobacteriota archaeon]